MWCPPGIPCQSPWPGQSRGTSPGGIAPLEASCFRRSAGSAVDIVSYRRLWVDGVAEDVGDGANGGTQTDGRSGVAAWKSRDARAELYWTMSLFHNGKDNGGGKCLRRERRSWILDAVESSLSSSSWCEGMEEIGLMMDGTVADGTYQVAAWSWMWVPRY